MEENMDIAEDVGKLMVHKFGSRDENYTKPNDPIRDMVISVLGFSYGNRISSFAPNHSARTVTVIFDDGTQATYDQDGQNVKYS